MSPRYVKQRDEYSCGPVSLLNLCKWAGEDCAYNDELYRWIKEHCGCKVGEGCDGLLLYATLLSLAREYNWAVRKRWDVSVKEMKEELDKGNAVLCVFEYDDGDDHIALLVGYNHKGFVAVNWWYDKDVVKNVGWKYMEEVRGRRDFACWFVRAR